MSNGKTYLTGLTEEEIRVLCNFISFPDSFCVDWFSVFPPSQLMSVIRSLEKEGWILERSGEAGCYAWSVDFPRQEITDSMNPEELSRCYRSAIYILMKNVAPDDATLLTIARQCLLAGVQEEDLDSIFKAAVVEEKKHKVSSAIELYDSILAYMERFIGREDRTLSDNAWCTFIRAVERRASLSLFHPSLKTITRLLLAALGTAQRLGDRKAHASMELLIGQNHWMYFQHEKAVEHFNRGWEIIQQLEDEALYKRGLKVQGLVYLIKGQFCKAIEVYEESLGELESADNNDFFMLAALNLALCYSEVGMPQRGLGITEAIQNQCQKTANFPLLSFSLVTAGMILLEIGQRDKSKAYLVRALELARQEKIPMVEVLAGISLSDVECQNGNFRQAGEHFNVIWRIKKSSWYHILNFFPIFETPFILHRKGVSPIELQPFFDFLKQIRKADLNPLMYGIIGRLRLGLPENRMTPAEKIASLLELETTLKRLGATFELAKIRIELARLYDQIQDPEQAEGYAKMAWDFFRPIAADSFPPDVKHLVPREKQEKDLRLFNLIVEMGEALTKQENIERLLTNIITSISRLMGSERAALFIRDRHLCDLRMVASRNLLPEEMQEDSFREMMAAIHTVADAGDGNIVRHEISGDGLSDSRRVIIAPLRLGKQTIGVLYQDSRFFSFDVGPDNIKLLSAFASQIAVSIDRAQAYEEIAQLNRKLIQENLYYLEEIEEIRPFGEIIGISNEIRLVQNLIRKVAPTQSTVLIHGETGVGKELVARAIHRESVRKDGPFIRVNCAALPETLIDSELFGYEKGAFTGAMKMKEGRFELANQGTIFLDEVSELPLSTQSRLLRILQEKEFQRVGGTKTLRSDFRLITATNKDLNREVADGRFRADLFFRLNVFPIFVPPLRERTEDIPHLAIHFLNLYGSQSNKEYSGIAESEMKRLQSYSWPGNIRELSNMIERAVILGGATIRFPELEGRKVKPSAGNQDVKLRDMERAHILKALEEANGRIGGAEGAAERLGLNRTTLLYRMKKLGIKVARHQTVLDEAVQA
ncbi:MAG: sigma 54-interacting transcriptional regulator [Syntrophaceae bacterium]|nr:sigma 54-interacting transcriptional regulator [Syntrophaceae bacterium]